MTAPLICSATPSQVSVPAVQVLRVVSVTDVALDSGTSPIANAANVTERQKNAIRWEIILFVW